MKHYAVGNFGGGSVVVVFKSSDKRDEFVAFGCADYRRKITAKDACKRLGVNRLHPVEITLEDTRETVYI